MFWQATGGEGPSLYETFYSLTSTHNKKLFLKYIYF